MTQAHGWLTTEPCTPSSNTEKTTGKPQRLSFEDAVNDGRSENRERHVCVGVGWGSGEREVLRGGISWAELSFRLDWRESGMVA